MHPQFLFVSIRIIIANSGRTISERTISERTLSHITISEELLALTNTNKS